MYNFIEVINYADFQDMEYLCTESSIVSNYNRITFHVTCSFWVSLICIYIYIYARINIYTILYPLF